MSAVTPSESRVEARGRRAPLGLLTVIRHNPGPSIALLALLALTVVAALSPVLFPHAPTHQVGPPYAGPSGAHLLGLDDGGNDVLGVLFWAARISLLVGVTAGVVAIVLGGVVGLVAGYFGGGADLGLMRIAELFLVVPVLPLMVIIAALYGSSVTDTIVIIGILTWAPTARVVRAQVKSVRGRLFVLRSRSIGAGHARILTRHVLPQVGPLLAANATLAVGNAIFFEAAMRFLGLGDQATTSWGQMIADAFNRGAITAGAWWVLVPPGVAIGFVLFVMTVVGRRVEDKLNPRLRVSYLGRRSFSGRLQPDARPAPSETWGRGPGESLTVAPALEVRDLHVWMAQEPDELHIVRGVDMAVEPGERFGLIGESGCGKTTLLMALMGLLPENATVAGQVLVGGVDVLAEGERSARRYRSRDIAIVFQGAMNALNPVLTVGRQVAEAARRLAREDGESPEQRVAEALRVVGLGPETARRYPHQLSGGQRQRVVIAMAIVCRPKVLLADEPTTALDVIVQAQVLGVLERACAELGVALVLVTHDLGVVAETCDRAAVMYGGEIVELGTVSNLYRAAVHPYTQLLVAATPRLGDRKPLASIPGSPPGPETKLPGCSFAARCPRRFEPCEDQAPPERERPNGHWVRCHLGDATALAGRSDDGR